MQDSITTHIERLPGLNRQVFNIVSDNIIEAVQQGNMSALELDLKLKAIEETIKAAREKINGNALKEAQQYHNSEASLLGVSFFHSDGHKTHIYECDPVWKELEFKKKCREELLKLAAKSDAAIYDEYGAEVPKVPIRGTKPFVRYDFPKS